jgi:hypothetical protein
VSSPLFEVDRVLMRLNHIASFIVKADHRVMRPAKKLTLKRFFLPDLLEVTTLIAVSCCVGGPVGWLPTLFLRSYFRNYTPHPLFPSMLFGSDCEQPPKATTLLLVRDSSGSLDQLRR